MSSLEKRRLANGFTFILRFRDGTGRQHSKSLKTADRKTAKKIQTLLDARLAQSKYLLSEPLKPITLSEFRRLYIQTYSSVNKSERTTDLDNRALKTLERYIGNLKLSEVTPQLIEEFKSDRILNVNPTTLNIELRCIRAAFNLAIQWDYLKTNPLLKTKQLKVPDSINPKFMNIVQLQAFLNCIDDIVHLALFSFYSSTGARRNEALGLEWADVDFDKSTALLRKTKGGKARVIPLRSKLKIQLEDLPHSSEFVFPFRPDFVNKLFRRYAKESGLPKHFSIHSLRHSFLTYAVSTSKDLRGAQNLAGHSRISTTEIYLHTQIDDLREIVEGLPY